MPKLLICASEAHKKDKKAATSAANLKKMIEKRVAKDAEDVKYNVITINTKMKLANVVAIINSSMAKLAEHEGVVTTESWTIHPDKQRGKWEIETTGGAAPKKSGIEADADADEASEKPKKKKKLKKKAKKD